jgi:hypothetical protein
MKMNRFNIAVLIALAAVALLLVWLVRNWGFHISRSDRIQAVMMRCRDTVSSTLRYYSPAQAEDIALSCRKTFESDKGSLKFVSSFEEPRDAMVVILHDPKAGVVHISRLEDGFSYVVIQADGIEELRVTREWLDEATRSRTVIGWLVLR